MDEALGKIKGFKFCHGIFNIIPVLALGAELFPDLKDRFLDLCLKLGELMWERYVFNLKMGKYSGLSGIGYLVHCLHRTFKKFSKGETKE